jgi:PAS domain S-box-containing protein
MEILYPDKTYREHMLEEIKKRGHDFRDWEWEITSKDGSVRTVTWFNVSKHFPIPGWNSWALGVDITERKQAEATLRESQERFKGAFYDAAFGMSIFDLEGRFLEVNAHFCRMLGYSGAELLLKSIYDITNPNDQGISRKRVAALLENREIDPQLEKRYVHKNGSVIWVAISSSPVRDANGDVLYFVSHIQDISLRKRAETALIASERRFSLFMDNLPGLAFMKDQSGRYVYVNAFFNDFFDVRDHRDVLGTRDEDWFPPEYVGQYRGNDKAVMSKGQAMDFTETGTSPAGPRYWLSCKFPIFEEDNPPLLGAVSIDITDRVEAEKALEASRQELKIHAENLRDLNTALKVLLDERDKEKKKQVADIFATMEKLVFPYLERLKGTRLTNEQLVFLDVVESNIRDIASPFASHLTSLETRLTPSELEVAQLLRDGKTSEEIAELLHVSVPTVSSHRGSIRRKLGLVNKSVNLKSYLRTFN